MEDHFIKNFEKLWPDHKVLFLDLDFEIILKILSSDKLKNGNQQTSWQVMHDWMENKIINREKCFKKLFIECLQFDNLTSQLVEDIFQSNAFKLLPPDFKKELKLIANNNSKQLLFLIDKDNGSVQYYNHQHNSWHSSPVSLKLPNGQEFYQLELLGSMLYAFGGKNDDLDHLNLVWSRDLSDLSSEWTAKADMNKCRVEHCSVVLNDTIYVMGGWGENYDDLSSCERYSSQLNQWSTVADMNTGRAATSAGVLNGAIYIAGGWSEEEELATRSVEKYDPQSNEWSQVAPMATARYAFVLTSFAGRLWAIGGRGYDHKPLSLVESYDPVTDSWREEAPLKEGRCKHAAIEFNGELYVVGGMTNWRVKNDPKVVEKYTPNIGWMKDSNISGFHASLSLFLIPSAYAQNMLHLPTSKKRKLNKHFKNN